MSQAGDDSKLDKVASGSDNDWDGASRLLSGESSLITPSYNDIDFVVNQFGSEQGKPIKLAFRISIFNDNIFPLHIAEFAQSCPEGAAPHAYLGRFKRTSHQVAEPCDFRRLSLSRETSAAQR